MAQDEINHKTDRELLILLCERIQVMSTAVDGVKKQVASLQIWRARLGGAWVAIAIVSGLLSSILSIVVTLIIRT